MFPHTKYRRRIRAATLSAELLNECGVRPMESRTPERGVGTVARRDPLQATSLGRRSEQWRTTLRILHQRCEPVCDQRPCCGGLRICARSLPFQYPAACSPQCVCLTPISSSSSTTSRRFAAPCAMRCAMSRARGRGSERHLPAVDAADEPGVPISSCSTSGCRTWPASTCAARSASRSAVPIIVLSARHSEHEKVDLLNAGRGRLRHQAVQRSRARGAGEARKSGARSRWPPQSRRAPRR